MLNKKNRLAKDRDIKRVLARGRGFFCPYFTLKYQKGVIIPRFTVVVSTKVSKKSVDRNRLKRIVRDLVRKSLPRMTPGEYILILKSLAGKSDEALILKSLQEILLKNKLLSN